MIYRLFDGRVIELKQDHKFTITEGRQTVSGVYIKSVLDTNKFVVNFKTNKKNFYIYFDLDTNVIIGESKGIIKLESFSKQTSKGVFRDVLCKLCSIIKRF